MKSARPPSTVPGRQADRARRTAFEVLRALRRGLAWEAAWERQAKRLASGSLDRRFAQELASGATRLRGRLDHVLTQHLDRPTAALDRDVLDLLRLGAYQLLETEVAEHSAVHATVELSKRVCPRATTLVNAVLRAVQRERRTLQFPDRSAAPLEQLVTYGSHPEWIVRRWLQRFGASETGALCDYDNRRPQLCLRPNPGRATQEEILAALPGSVVGRWAASSLRCSATGYAAVRALVEAGKASVQDESATLVVEEAAPAPGEAWLDLAAAPGGKAGHLAERVGEGGRVLAFDTTAAKVGRLRANAERLGLPQLVAAVGEARSLRLPPADGVLLDAPCSGLGVLARRPDARWRKQPGDPARLAALQAELLEAAAVHVRPGGLLVYSVCSFEPEETEAVASAFSAQHPEFALESGPAAPELRSGPGILYLLPQRHGVDGGFVARWRRAP